MSRKSIKIANSLLEKGYFPKAIIWNPVRRGPEMCGPEGGWYVEVYGKRVDEDGDREFIDVVCAYSVDEMLEEIRRLPQLSTALAEKGAEHEKV